MKNSGVTSNRLNDLDGSKWLLFSKSVWDDIVTSSAEKTEHPAQFPLALVRRLLEVFTRKDDVVLDPFLGSGTTLIACRSLQRYGIGVELSPDYVELTRSRLAFQTLDAPTEQLVLCADSRRLLQLIDINQYLEKIGKKCVDFAVTSPPYWDVLHESRKKTVLPREKHPTQYSDLDEDVGNIHDYEEFLDSLKDIFGQVFRLLQPNKYCVIITMDIRKGSKVYPLHSDIVDMMSSLGFSYQDVIIWNRDREYNYLRPMGYPTTFIVNRVHEYVLIFKKRNSSDTENLVLTASESARS